MTVRIVGFDKAESGMRQATNPDSSKKSSNLVVLDLILNYLYDVYERNVDIQVRFKWTSHASGKSFFSSTHNSSIPLECCRESLTLYVPALWDNRITQHIASWDYEGKSIIVEPRVRILDAKCCSRE